MLPRAAFVAGAFQPAALRISPFLNLGPSSLTIKPHTPLSRIILIYFLPSLIVKLFSKLASVLPKYLHFQLLFY
jgi:hypothetical protein